MCGPKPCELEGCTWGEKHRIACEARLVLTWPLHMRRDYLEKIGKRSEALKAAMAAEWSARERKPAKQGRSW